MHKSINYPNGLKTVYEYDNINRITGMTVSKGNTVLYTLSYTYDANGNILSETRNGQVTSYSYDCMDRLSSVTYSDGNTVSYEYDAVGNRTKETYSNGDVKDYLYNKYNQLAEIKLNGQTTDTYTYNAMGAVTSHNNKTFTYDEWDKMTGYSDGTETYTYEYDVNGIRTVKNDKMYVVDVKDNVIAEADADGEITDEILWGHKPLARKVNGVWYYYVYNAHGDVIAMTDGNGNVVNSYIYDAWGDIVSQTETVSNPIKYAGEYYDDELGMYYLRARYYDPKIGRFIQSDPIESGMNWYVYCDNNPVNRIDPSGLYDRKKAVEFAMKYAQPTAMQILEYDYTYNGPDIRFNQDCTNFVSWCLYKGGGMKQSEDWYYKWAIRICEHVPGPYSKTWSVSEEQFKAFTNCTGDYPNTNYADGNAICIHESKWIAAAIEEYNIRPGDLLYFLDPQTNKMGHTSIIVSTDNGIIKYAQHDDDKKDGNLNKYLDETPDDGTEFVYVYVVRIRDDA